MTRLPAIPLITADPYFSVWMPADTLTQAQTAHWCRSELPIHGLMTVDGEVFRFLGLGEEPEIATADLKVTPCKTTALYQNDKISLELSFMTPFLPDDLDRASTPVCLIEAEAKSLDGKAHDVSIEFCFSDKFCYRGDEKPEIAAYPMPYSDLNMMSIGRIEQKILCHSGDGVTIDWGYLYAGAQDATLSFENDALNVHLNNKQVSSETAVFRMLAGYDDIASILYFGWPCKAWYARNGKTLADAMRETWKDFDLLKAKCDQLDERICKEAQEIGGDEYVYIVSAAYRHVFAAHKLAADREGNMIFISKENNSNGCAGTVDVSYPSTPMFLKYCPQLVNAMCRPVLRFARMDVWSKYDFAPHDVGRYPIVNGQVYGSDRTMDLRKRIGHQPPYYLMPAEPERYVFRSQMPVEESGNMLIMMYAAAFFSGDDSLIREYRDLTGKWVKYLLTYGEDPGEQLCTDDFAGHLNHNVNLSAKAIVGIACYGRMLDMIGEDGSEYSEKARQMAKSWLERADAPEGSYLTFEKQGWSMKYNTAWDKVFGFGLFGDDFYRHETRSYLKHINAYGLPLDNRATYTKSDWELWCAAIAPDRDVKDAIIHAVAEYLRNTTSRVAFSDWYDTITGVHEQFIARSVQGGLFMPFLCK